MFNNPFRIYFKDRDSDGGSGKVSSDDKEDSSNGKPDRPDKPDHDEGSNIEHENPLGSYNNPRSSLSIEFPDIQYKDGPAIDKLEEDKDKPNNKLNINGNLKPVVPNNSSELPLTTKESSNLLDSSQKSFVHDIKDKTSTVYNKSIKFIDETYSRIKCGKTNCNQFGGRPSYSNDALDFSKDKLTEQGVEKSLEFIAKKWAPPIFSSIIKGIFKYGGPLADFLDSTEIGEKHFDKSSIEKIEYEKKHEKEINDINNSLKENFKNRTFKLEPQESSYRISS